MNKEKRKTDKEKKRIDDLMKEFVKRSKELAIQEKKFRNKVFIDYKKK